MTEKTIYTIGHSTHNFDVFIEMLQSFDIKLLADIRSLRGFTQVSTIQQRKLRYIH